MEYRQINAMILSSVKCFEVCKLRLCLHALLALTKHYSPKPQL